MTALAGRRILIVEDEFIIALSTKEMLTEIGAIVIGPAASIADGLSLAKSEMIDAAVLDMNIRGDRIDPVVDVLTARNVPIVYTTGYGEGTANQINGAPSLGKPYTSRMLADAVSRVLKLRT